VIKSSEIKNLTVFQQLNLQFTPGINAFVGENGSGKTHLLKALYAIDKARAMVPAERSEQDEVKLPVRLVREQLIVLFQAIKQDRLYRHGRLFLEMSANWGDEGFLSVRIDTGGGDGSHLNLDLPHEYPVFFPSEDVLGHSFGFRSLYERREIDFDQSFKDLLDALALSPLRDVPHQETLQTIEAIIGGSVEIEGERFYLGQGSERIEAHMAAQGWRKLAALYLLLRNGSLGPGRVLFWDEPEANLNPKLMDEVIRALLLLARSGVQVFLATHSYVMLKEMDLQTEEEDEVRYFAFATGPNGTSVSPTDEFALLTPNAILEQYEHLYDRELTRATGRRRTDSANPH
jgi:hypothetical protein